ncbi:1-carboxybiuret hydrolase subunit AtzG-like [Burkholderiaceae bacterium]
MTEQDTLALVLINAKTLGIPLEAERAARVAAHLHRTVAMAQMLEGAHLTPADEPAEIFCPKPH